MTALRRSLQGGALGLLLSVLAAGVTVAPTAAAAPTSADLVVQVDQDRGYAIGDVTTRFALVNHGTLVRSAGIYLVRTTTAEDAANVNGLIDSMTRSGLVSNAASEPKSGYSATRFHSWPSGGATTIGSNATAYRNQPIAADLSSVHAIIRGSGVTVAVLDTGADRDHPALAGRLVTGYDYVDDDADPSERRQDVDTSSDGRRDSSYGHGTFVAGTVSLIAPDARVMPMRVLDSDGVGNVVVIAQAIRDAVRRGSGVINLSFGTESSLNSPVLDRALRAAKDAGVLVVGAAGNRGSAQPLYPGSSTDVVSVTCFDPTSRAVPSYASFGVRVNVAARGSDVVGPLPGGTYATWSGTSMAAPQVAAQAALIRSRVPRLSWSGQLEAITKTTTALRPVTAQYGAVEIPASLSYATKP